MFGTRPSPHLGCLGGRQSLLFRIEVGLPSSPAATGEHGLIDEMDLIAKGALVPVGGASIQGQ